MRQKQNPAKHFGGCPEKNLRTLVPADVCTAGLISINQGKENPCQPQSLFDSKNLSFLCLQIANLHRGNGCKSLITMKNPESLEDIGLSPVLPPLFPLLSLSGIFGYNRDQAGGCLSVNQESPRG